MSQTVSMDVLQNETDRLRSQVEALQRCLALRGEVAAPVTESDEDVWGVWPYSWAQSCWGRTVLFFDDRLHSFHKNHHLRRLTRENLEAHAKAIHFVETGHSGLRLL